MNHDIEEKASDLARRGDYSAALRLRLDVEESSSRTAAQSLDRARNLNYIASLAVRVGDLAEAERAARKCLELYQPLPAAESEKLATYSMVLSCVLAENGKFEDAVVYGSEAVELFSRIHGENNQFVIDRRRDVERMRCKDTSSYLEK